MKVYLTLVLFYFTITNSLSSQVPPNEWFPVGTQWIYLEIGINDPVKETLVQVTQDTVIQGLKCRVLEVLTEESFFPEGVPEVILYTTGDIVYQYAEEEFHILYDFTLSAGDTIELYVPYGGIDNSKRHREVVDSVKIINIGGKALRAYWTRPMDNNSSWFYNYGFPVIERIGGTGFIVPQDQLSEVAWGPMTYFKDSCITVNIINPSCTASTCEYRLTQQDCELISPTHQSILREPIKIYPNPTRDWLTIHQLPAPITHYAIYDLNGQLLLQKQSFQSLIKPVIPVHTLSNGIYILQLTTEAMGMWSTRFVVQR